MQARRRAGLSSFPVCSLLQDQLVEPQIRDSPSQLFILLLESLQFFQLIYAHPAILLAPAVVGLFNYSDLPNRIQTRHALPHQNLNLP